MTSIDDHIADTEKEEDENEDGQSDSSSELVELEGEDTKPADQESEWRKGRLSTAQHGMKKFDKLFSPPLQQIVRQSEAKLVELLDEKLELVNKVDSCLESKDRLLGENIRKALFTINKISDSVIISLKRPNVTLFLGKVFEYLKGTPQNPIVCLRILYILNKTRFEALNLSKVEEVITTPEYLEFLLEVVLEANVAKDSDLRIGHEALKFCYKHFLGVITKVNRVFSKHFDILKEAMHKKRLDIHLKKGISFRMSFIPFKRLEKADTDFIKYELECTQNTETKLSTEHTVAFYSHLVKNKHFKPNEKEVERIINDANDLAFSIARKPQRLQKIFINKMAALLANLIFKPQLSEEEVSLIINATVGFFDTIVDEFHPKTTLSVKKAYYQYLIQFFLTHYVREAKKCRKKSPELYAKIKEAFHPVLRKIMNFSIFDKFTGSFEKSIMALCYLDRDYFMGYLLDKIKFSFNFEEFRKADVIKLLGSVTEIISADPQYSDHLIWIVPKLLSELTNAAEAKSVEEISSVIASILENFTALDDLKEKSHLVAFRNDIDEAAIRYFDFYLGKADTYIMRKEALKIVLSISDYTKSKVKERMLDLIKRGFSKVSVDNVLNFISASYRFMPKDIDDALVSWIKNKVLVETEPYNLDTLVFGPSLVEIGVPNPFNLKLGSTNETALKEQAKVLRGVMQLAYLISDDLLKLTASSLSMIVDSDNDEVSKNATVAMCHLFIEVLPKVLNVVSVAKMQETTNSREGCSALIWEIPEKTHQARLRLLLKAFLLTQFEQAQRLMDVPAKREAAADPITLLYKDTLAQKTQDDVDLEQSNKALVNKLVAVLRFIALMFKDQWIRSSYLNSTLLQEKFSSLKKECLTFFVKSGTFNNPKLRDAYLSLLMTNLRVSNLALEGEEYYLLCLKAMQGYYAYFDEVDTSFKTLMMEMILNNYLSFYGYFYRDGIFNFDSLETGTMQTETEPHRLWLFGGQLEKTFVTEALEEVMENSIFFAVENMQQILQKETNKHFDRWVILEESHIREKLLYHMQNIMTIEQGSSEKYTTTANHMREAVYLFMSKIYIGENSTVEAVLALAKTAADKGDFSKIQGLYFQFTNYLLMSTALTSESKWRQELSSSLTELRSKDDSTLTLADLIFYSVKILLTYKTWTAEDRAEFGMMCLLGASSKNINKRIVYMSMVFFLNRLLKTTDWQEDKVIIDNKAFADERGIITASMTREVFQEIKHRIGFSDQPSDKLTKEQQEKLASLSPSCFPGQAAQYLTLPFEALTFTKKEDTVTKFQEICEKRNLAEDLEKSFLDFLKIVIMEYSDSVEESSLTVKYSYAEYMVSMEKKGVVNRESLVLVTFKQSALLLGVPTIRRIMKKLEEETQEKNSDYKKVVLIMYCALISASNAYTDAEFAELIAYGKELFVPLMNSLNSKHLQTLMIYLFVSLKNSLNFGRLKVFYDSIIVEMSKSQPENKVHFLNLLVFQPSTCALILSDSVLYAFLQEAPNIDIQDLNNVRTLTKFYATITSIRYLASFTVNFQTAESLSSQDLTQIALNDKDKIVQEFVDFLHKVKTTKILTRMECLKTMLMLLHIKTIDEQNYEVMESMIALVFTLDPNEDLGISQLVTASHKMIEQIRHQIELDDSVKDRFLAFLSKMFDTLHSVDCLKSLIKMIRRGIGNKITPALRDLLFKIARDPRITLRDSIDSLFRHDVFSPLSNREMYAFAKDIFQMVDKTMASK